MAFVSQESADSVELPVPNGQDCVIVEVHTWDGTYQTLIDRAKVPIADFLTGYKEVRLSMEANTMELRMKAKYEAAGIMGVWKATDDQEEDLRMVFFHSDGKNGFEGSNVIDEDYDDEEYSIVEGTEQRGEVHFTQRFANGDTELWSAQMEGNRLVNVQSSSRKRGGGSSITMERVANRKTKQFQLTIEAGKSESLHKYNLINRRHIRKVHASGASGRLERHCQILGVRPLAAEMTKWGPLPNLPPKPEAVDAMCLAYERLLNPDFGDDSLYFDRPDELKSWDHRMADDPEHPFHLSMDELDQEFEETAREHFRRNPRETQDIKTLTPTPWLLEAAERKAMNVMRMQNEGQLTSALRDILQYRKDLHSTMLLHFYHSRRYGRAHEEGFVEDFLQ